MENGNGKQIEHRITKLEVGMDNLNKEINEIIVNHLPHMDKRIEGIHKSLDKFMWILVTVLFGMLVDIIIHLIKLNT